MGRHVAGCGCVLRQAQCAEERARGMVCADGGMYVGGETSRGQEVAVEEVVVVGWMYAGDSELAEKTGGRMFYREEVIFVGEGHFLRMQTDSREIVKFIETGIFAEDASGVGHALDEAGEWSSLQRRADLG
ncbi:hypothetical protein EDD85DRAFT_955473 [Armillaria nabsnona]|nr:hypothetical protein EDD85DRAFT_955473 [Armillaria nabsnona]